MGYSPTKHRDVRRQNVAKGRPPVDESSVGCPMDAFLHLNFTTRSVFGKWPCCSRSPSLDLRHCSSFAYLAADPPISWRDSAARLLPISSRDPQPQRLLRILILSLMPRCKPKWPTYTIPYRQRWQRCHAIKKYYIAAP